MPKGRILAVDDQRYFRELVEALLTEEGFEAQTAASGEEALRILAQSRFDILLTDLVMPGMDGSELVHRVKDQWPDQDIVVVTGVVDVKTAVEAMKLGATDYLLKPFDRSSLANALENILQQKRLRSEHARLLAENIEYLGERSLFERAIALFSRLSVPPLAEAIVEGLCVEVQAQGGVLWTLREDDRSSLALAAARGLVRIEEEIEVLDASDLPSELRQGKTHSMLLEAAGPHGPRQELVVALRREGRVIGCARLTDKLDGQAFDSIDRGCVERFAGFAEVALGNAMRFRDLERRTLEDPITGAYIFQYFQDVARNEIEKANRFGRSFSLLKLDLGSLDPVRHVHGETRVGEWLAHIVGQLRELLRATDLLAVDADDHFWALLPEADALGAAVLKQRAFETLEQSELLAALDRAGGRAPLMGLATFPGDGTQLESLTRVLDRRLEEERRSRSRIAHLARLSFDDCLKTLLDEGAPTRGETAAQIARFVLEDVARRPSDRALLFVAPGRALRQPVSEALAALHGTPLRTEIAVVAEGERPPSADSDVMWISRPGQPGAEPFLIHFGDGPAYAFVRDAEDSLDGVRFFHTSDRSLVEHLAFRLQRELALPQPADLAGAS